MSDALVTLMEPYIDWPPTPSELADVEAWLSIGAAVWNATVRAEPGGHLREELGVVLDEWELSDEDDPEALVEEIAARKLQLFADDYRLVGGVQVRAEGGMATVEAMSLAYLR